MQDYRSSVETDALNTWIQQPSHCTFYQGEFKVSAETEKRLQSLQTWKRGDILTVFATEMFLEFSEFKLLSVYISHVRLRAHNMLRSRINHTLT
jgi:hypothetical protein